MLLRSVGVRTLAICALTLAAATARAQTAAARSPRNANYQIEVALDPHTRTLNAHENITWRNITHNPTSELQFHLYWNAWADTKSTWMRETARTREVHRPKDDFPITGACATSIAATDDGSGDGPVYGRDAF